MFPRSGGAVGGTAFDQRGFTLLELLVVMVIIGLLASYVGPKYFGQIGKSEVKTARAQLDSFGKALDQYRLDTGHYPATDLGLNALVARPANEPKWSGPYLTKAVPMDPWGSILIYKSARRAWRLRLTIARQRRTTRRLGRSR